MDALTTLSENAVLTWALLACGVAQLSKLLVVLVTERQWRPAVLLETGGMPSSHAALVSGVAAGVGWQVGFDQPLFALACALALVVMYDASGVRRAAGLQAERLNTYMTPADPDRCSSLEPLNTNLGHTRRQVLVGSLLGIVVVLLGISRSSGVLDLPTKMEREVPCFREGRDRDQSGSAKGASSSEVTPDPPRH